MLVDGSLSEKVCVVTGGGTGLGRAIALELSRLGAGVAVLGRRPEPLEETVQELDGSGLAVPCDVREPEAVAAAFETVERALGPPTTLVNNAAGNFVVQAEELSPNGWRAVVGIVLDGTFYCSRELGRRRGLRPRVVRLRAVPTHARTVAAATGGHDLLERGHRRGAGEACGEAGGDRPNCGHRELLPAPTGRFARRFGAAFAFLARAAIRSGCRRSHSSRTPGASGSKL